MPKVTIVLPTYNGSQYIREAIDSVINQTFEDWELIIVNDCSTDDTPIIIDEYFVKDSRIRVINNSANQKLPRSLNIGFKRSKGKYLTWTSDDNYYLHDAIECMVAYLDENKSCPMVCANMDTIDQSGKIIGEFANYDRNLMLYNDCVGACFLYRQEILDEVGEYDPNWFLVEDYEYWLRILFRCGEIGHIDRTLYRYRYHNSSLTGTRMQSIKSQLHELRKKYIKEICKGLKENIELLSCVFCEMYNKEPENLEYMNEIINIVPELKNIHPLLVGQNVAIYGAGDYGNRAYNLIEDAVVVFIDSNPAKYCESIHGRKIINIEDYLERYSDVQVLIAVSDRKVIDVVKSITSKGIESCAIYQGLEGVYEN